MLVFCVRVQFSVPKPASFAIFLEGFMLEDRDQKKRRHGDGGDDGSGGGWGRNDPNGRTEGVHVLTMAGMFVLVMSVCSLVGLATSSLPTFSNHAFWCSVAGVAVGSAMAAISEVIDSRRHPPSDRP